MTWDHARGYDPLAASAAAYEKENGVKIQWDKRSLKDFGDASLEQLAERYDLVVLDHPHVGVAAASGCLRPLDSLLTAESLQTLAENSVGPSFASYNYTDHQWALPLDAACQVSACRPDLLGSEPLPETWDAVFTLAEKLKNEALYVGMALCPTDCLCSFLTLCAQSGEGPAEGKTELASTPTGLSVLDTLRRLRDACHPDSLQWNPIALFDQMARSDGRIAYAPLAFGYTNYARPDYAEKTLRFGSIPGKANTLLGGAGIALSKRCAAPEAAADYLKWLCGAECQRGLYTASGGQPGNAAAWEDPEADATAGNFFSGTFDTIRQAFVRPRAAEWPVFQEYLGERVHRFLKEHESPEQTLLDLQERYRQTFNTHTI